MRRVAGLLTAGEKGERRINLGTSEHKRARLARHGSACPSHLSRQRGGPDNERMGRVTVIGGG
jgi:hypothetical protein